ncbi:MAG: TIGR00282 family metallophosphoesterase [Alphaproteobacteria bacterium]
MRILFCGDVVGRSGREVLKKHIKPLRERLRLDCVIANGENAAHGFGITENICKELYEIGVDVITTGNHVWDQQSVISYISNNKFLLKPINYPKETPGQGFTIFKTQTHKSILVINVMGRLFIDSLDDPFKCVNEVLKQYPLKSTVDAIVIDIHAEATSEKMAMGHFCDGRVSLVIGTHTHVPTIDHRILEKGTAYQSDVGMCGCYDSVVGMEKSAALERFLKRMPKKLEPAAGEGTLCAVYLEICDETGLSKKIEPIRLGGVIKQEFFGEGLL